jgi:hypothetical protein
MAYATEGSYGPRFYDAGEDSTDCRTIYKSIPGVSGSGKISRSISKEATGYEQ